jgi:hypothetical protein
LVSGLKYPFEEHTALTIQILSIYLVNYLKAEALDMKSQILATQKTFAGYGHAVWPRLAKY